MWNSTTAILFLVTVVASTQAAAIAYNQPRIKSFFLGSVDGKSYMADNTTSRSWSESAIYCTSIGMRLASVASVAQKDFLAGINNPNFQSTYWTGGRDAQSPQQFVWNHNSSPLSESFVNIYSYANIATCVYYSSALKRYYSGACSGTRGALCESS